MAIKSEENLKNTVVSKKKPVLRIGKKENLQKNSKVLNIDNSTIDVSSKKSKRIISRKISKKAKKETIELVQNNNIKNLDEVSLKDLEKNLDTKILETPSSEETQIIEFSSEIVKNEKSDLLEEKTENNHSTLVSEKSNKQEKNNDILNTEISKDLKNSKSNNISKTESLKSVEKNKEENEEETLNIEEKNSKKSSTVIKPNYIVHKPTKSRRTISLNLDKNIDELVAPVIKEKDTSINQNSSFFYEPSVFQRFNINVTSAESDNTDFEDSQISESSKITDEIESSIDEPANVEISKDNNTLLETTDFEINSNNLNLENNSEEQNNSSSNFEEMVITETIYNTLEDLEIVDEIPAPIEESVDLEIVDEVPAPIEESVDLEIVDEVTAPIEESVDLEIIDEVPTPIEESVDLEIVDEVTISNENNNISSDNINDTISELDEKDTSLFEESDITDENIEDLITLDDLLELVDNKESISDQSTISEELLNIENLIIDTNSDTFENDNMNPEKAKKESIEETEENMQEVADSIIILEKQQEKNKKTVSTFFESSIPSIASELSNSQNIATHKKNTSSISSNIFKKFTFDEANLKNTELGINAISIQETPNNIEITNALEKYNSSENDLKDLEVTATPAILTVPTAIDIDSTDVLPTSDTNSNDEVSNTFYNIVTPNSISDDKFEDEDVLENQNSEKDQNKQHINLDDISIEDLDLLDNIDVQDLENFSDEDLDIIDETFINENPLEDDSLNASPIEETFEEYAEDYNNTLELENDTFEEEYEEYDFESKKMSNTYYTEDEEFSIEDYFGLNNLQSDTALEGDSEEINEFENNYEDELFYEEYEDTDGIELDNDNSESNEDFADNLLNANSTENISAFSKLIENFTQTISTLSDRIADLENNKGKKIDSESNVSSEDILDNSDIEILENQTEQEVTDSNEPTILDDISEQDLLNNISLDDISIDDISLDDISILDSNEEIIENPIILNELDEKQEKISELNEDKIILDNDENTTLDFNLPLNDSGITEEPNLFDSLTTDDFNFEDFSLEDLGSIDLNDDTSKSDDNKSIEDILTKTFSSENYKNMKNDLLSELEENSDTSPSILNAPEEITSDDATSDFFKIIDTLTKTITELESTPNMESNNISTSSNSGSEEILNVPAELTGEGKAINILINKDDIFSISILNETYEIVADFDGISVLSENIHISTPKKNFFVKVGEKYIEIHNNNDNFLVLTNFEDIEFANAINNVAFGKKNNKIELNIKEAFKLSSVNNKIELSMLNTSVADMVNAGADNTENVDESSVCDNRTLLISEETQKVYLPYTIEEVMKKLNSSKEYQTVEEVIENEYTVPLSTFKMPIISRFREAYRFMRVKEKSSVYAAVDLALELMFSSNLNPAVIRAAKDLKELNIYLDCLYENEIEKFDCFKVIYKLLPKIK